MAASGRGIRGKGGRGGRGWAPAGERGKRRGLGSWGPAVGGRGGKARSLGVDREDRSARKRREAEGEGVSRAGGKREGASRAGARARRRDGEEEEERAGGSYRRGRGGRRRRGVRASRAVSWGGRRENKGGPRAQPLEWGRGSAGAHARQGLGVSGSLTAVEAAAAVAPQ